MGISQKNWGLALSQKAILPIVAIAWSTADACQCRRIVPADFLYAENDYGYVGEVSEIGESRRTAAGNCKTEVLFRIEKVLHGSEPSNASVQFIHTFCEDPAPFKNRILWTNCDYLSPPAVGTKMRIFGKKETPVMVKSRCNQVVAYWLDE